MTKSTVPEKTDPGLTDADWAEINTLKKAYQTGGQKALSKAMDDLAKDDPAQHIRIRRIFPRHGAGDH